MPVHLDREAKDAVALAKAARTRADREGFDLLIADTAGRLHVDEELMGEVARVHAALEPHRDAARAGRHDGPGRGLDRGGLHEALPVSGFVPARRWTATRAAARRSRSARSRGAPIRYLGIGEKVEAARAVPRGSARRRASSAWGRARRWSSGRRSGSDLTKAEALEKKLRKERFTLEDFLGQLQEMKKLGPLEEIVKMLPGMKLPAGAQTSTSATSSATEAIIQSMTREERERPAILNGSRRKRIARGSGTTVQDVNRVLRQLSRRKPC